MKKILVVGNSPLPNQNEKSRPAAGLRTYQFVKSFLKKSDYAIKLITVAMPQCYHIDIEGVEREDFEENCERVTISKNNPALKTYIQKECDDFDPDVLIGVNTYPSSLVAGLDCEAPFWADLNGWIMAEAQAQAFKMDSNDYIWHYLGLEKAVLKRADKFSCVSKAQNMALLGELAAVGRLNKQTFGYQFGHHIANGTEFFEGEDVRIEDLKSKKILKKLKKIPEGAFTLLWIGGYNTWVDEQTLFEGIEEAMMKCDDLYFLSTGGGIEGLDSKTFKGFQKKIEKSEYKDRFVFLGWVDTEVIPYLYKVADVGINVDRMCVETLTGARNRINEMMKFGIPVVSTRGSEIAEEVEKREAGIVVESGESGDFADAIIKLYRLKEENSDELRQFGENGAKYIRDECNYKVLQRDLMKWVESAKRAPDSDVRIVLGSSGKLKAGWRYLKENGLRKFLKKLAIPFFRNK